MCVRFRSHISFQWESPTSFPPCYNKEFPWPTWYSYIMGEILCVCMLREAVEGMCPYLQTTLKRNILSAALRLWDLGILHYHSRAQNTQVNITKFQYLKVFKLSKGMNKFGVSEIWKNFSFIFLGLHCLQFPGLQKKKKNLYLRIKWFNVYMSLTALIFNRCSREVNTINVVLGSYSREEQKWVASRGDL